MAILHLDSLPPRTTKGTLVRLLTQVGQCDRKKVGAIELRGRSASIEVPDRLAAKLARALDGTNIGHQLIRAWHDAPGADEGQGDHFSRLLQLLELEADAEAEEARRERQRLTPQEAERSGFSLVDLMVQDQSMGLGGRSLVKLTKRTPGQPLPWSRLGMGSPVVVSVEGESSIRWRGVISFRDETSVEVAITQAVGAEMQSESIRLDRSSDEVASQRQKQALQRARAARGDRLAILKKVLLGEQRAGIREPSPVTEDCVALNLSQQDAIQTALAAEDVAIIHGPPGTGKTTTVVALIRQAVQSGRRVLACAPSNIAVDNVCEKLVASGANPIRLGHPARVLPELRDRTLDLMVERHSEIKLARKLMREAFALLDKADKYTRAKPAPGARREQREEAKQMLDDARRLEAQVCQQLLDSTQVLCTTLTAIDSDLLGQREFDLAVIDEACQSTEPACWIPLLRSQRVVLAGDHCQLPPTVVSPEAARDGLAVSLLERLMSARPDHVTRQLTTQYRMHQDIMDFSSAEFYGDSLIADDSVREHRLDDLPGVAAGAPTQSPLRFIDTAGAGFDEQIEDRGRSHLNPAEAEVVMRQAQLLLELGLDPTQVAIISPYSAQVRTLRERAEFAMEIDTVDGFQGREKEAIVISLVRSNSTGEIGFLADTRRMNVAMTRARRKLVMVGDSATIASHPFYQRLLDYVEQRGGYHTIWEEEFQ